MLRCSKDASSGRLTPLDELEHLVPSISDTIRRLQSGKLAEAIKAPSGHGRLVSAPSFEPNPGALNGWRHVPDGVTGMALVVVLHGCTQTAAAYDHGSGWSELAERHGFAVLFPEQRRANNPNLCFNWFSEEDTRRDEGEALSIRRMIEAMIDDHPIDPARVFITGLSAGGAMTSVMLATYPEVFAAGGIIAGLPHGAAASVPQALERMQGRGHPSAATYAGRVRDASPHRGPWPRISVWHGNADATVRPGNADAVIGQWRELHGVGTAPDRVETVDGHQREVWLDAQGREVIDHYRIAGMGHGTPLKTGGEGVCGVAGPHMLEAGISSTLHLARNWGLLRDVPRTCAPAEIEHRKPDPASQPARGHPASGVQATIEAALRSAGLMR